MRTIMTMLAGTAGLAMLATAAPAAAQYAYGYNPYGYASPYGAPYGNAYGYYGQQQAQLSSMATNQCAAAVHHRLATRATRGMGGIIGAVLGTATVAPQGRVVSFTRIEQRRGLVRVRGLASSGTQVAYSPYGYGAYGATGYGHQADLSFRCDVGYDGRVHNVKIDRR